MKKTLLLSVLALSFFVGFANPKERCTFTRVTVDQGLSANNIAGICQDKLGRMWFATNDGINCYNGYDLVIYRYDPDNDSSIPSNVVNNIYLDNNSDIWACTANGLAKFDYEKSVFHRVHIADNIHSIENITQISHNIFLVGTRQETFFYDSSSGRTWPCQLNGKNIAFYSIFVNEGEIVVGTVREKELMALAYEGGELKQRGHSVKMHYTITSILKASNGSYWVGLSKGGLYLVDLKNGTLSDPGEFLPESLSIGPLAYDKYGRLWVGTSDGLYVLEPTSRYVTKYSCDSNVLSLSHDSIRCLYSDQSAGMWIGTEFGGVNYWSGKNVFYPLEYSDSQSTSDRIVTTMCMDEDNYVWIGTRHAGLHHHSLTTGKTDVYDIDNIRSIHSTNDKIYVGTIVNGWKIIDKKTGSVISYSYPSDVNDFLLVDDSRVLIGSLSGVYIYNPHSKILEKIKSWDEGNGIRALCLEKDSRGMIWIGAKEGIIRLVAGNDGSLVDVNENLPEYIVQVHCFYESSDSLMWIGTSDGLFKYDYSNCSVSRVSGVSCLNQITINGIEEDSLGNLWISTDNGLTRYNPKNGDNRTYYMKDGLSSNQFNAYSSHCSDSYGNLYFGGVGGVTTFDPIDVVDNHEVFSPIITGLKLFGTDVHASDDTGILSKDISMTESIELRHDQNTITLTFACADFASDGRNRFKYKMEGVDKDWIDADGRSVTYSNLDKGSYRFVLAVSNSDGIWSTKYATLEIQVLPVWYRTIWAEVLFIAFILILLSYAVICLIRYINRKHIAKIDVLERKLEGNVRRVRVASYVADVYNLKSSEEEFIEKVINHIDQNIVNAQFSVEMLASLMFMTRANLHLKVKSITGISPVELIRKIRVETACRLIKEGRHSLTEVGELSGFNSTTYFVTTFKKIVGTTPGDFATSVSSKN